MIDMTIHNRKILDPIIRAAKSGEREILIKPFGTHVEIIAISKDYAVRRMMSVGAEHGAPVAIPVEAIERLLKAVPKKEHLGIEIEYTDRDAVLVRARAGKATYDLTADLRRYIDLDPRLDGDLNHSIVLDAESLRKKLDIVYPAMGNDIARPHLHGIQLEEYDSQGVRAIATNGYWLCMSGRGLHDTSNTDNVKTEIFIPGELVKHARGALKDALSASVESGSGMTRVSIRDDAGWITYAAPSHDQFPSYRKVIPATKSYSRIATFAGATEIIDAVKQVEPFGADLPSGQAVQVSIGAPDSNGVTVRAESEYGRSEARITADKIEAGQAYNEGGVESFGISGKYLRESLASVASFGGRINIAIGTRTLDPVTIISECGENLAVVMPTRI